VQREEHARGRQIPKNYISHKEEMGGGALLEGPERAVSHHVSPVCVCVCVCVCLIITQGGCEASSAVVQKCL